jgi:hypothetical protein
VIPMMFPRKLKIAISIDAPNAVPSDVPNHAPNNRVPKVVPNENDNVVPKIVPYVPLSILSAKFGISLYSSNTP